MSDFETFVDEYNAANNCCLTHALFTPDDVDHIIAMHHEEGGWAESETTVIVQLKNGRYGMFTASEDTTGHGCRCSGMTVVEDTLHGIVNHLTGWELDKFLSAEWTMR